MGAPFPFHSDITGSHIRDRVSIDHHDYHLTRRKADLLPDTCNTKSRTAPLGSSDHRVLDQGAQRRHERCMGHYQAIYQASNRNASDLNQRARQRCLEQDSCGSNRSALRQSRSSQRRQLVASVLCYRIRISAETAVPLVSGHEVADRGKSAAVLVELLGSVAQPAHSSYSV